MVITNPNNFHIVVVGVHNSDGSILLRQTVEDHKRKVVSMEFEKEQLLNGSEISNSSISVYSNETFNLYIILYTNTTNREGFVAVPKAHLGNEYFVSTFCALGGYCQIAVASSEGGKTQVYVELPSEAEEIVLCVAEHYWRSKTDTTVTLTYPEVLQIETTHDLTGTRIFADKPVGVFVGSRSIESLYHMLEQLVPVTEFGSKFIFKTIGTNSYGNIVHITCRSKKTVVKMSGFPTVELSRAGQTIYRRTEVATMYLVESSKPVQIVLYKGLSYATSEPVYNPGMTLVPATQHFKDEYVVACKNTDLISIQLISIPGSDVYVNGNQVTFTEETLPYDRSYGVRETTLSSQEIYSLSAAAHTTVFGGVMECGGHSVFPMAHLVLQTTDCISDTDVMSPADGLDNDCDGKVDEAYCFENRRITTTFVSSDDSPVRPSTNISVSGFNLLKLRILTCGSVLLELRGHNISTDKVIVHITQTAIFVYECFPNCYVHHFQDISDYIAGRNCSTDIAFFWIRHTASRICIGTGPFPPHDCSSSNLTYTHSLMEILFNGLFSSATFWLDKYNTDCKKLDTEWRCEDKITNCDEYGPDVCTNADYSTWVSQNCLKYCELCGPSSFGKMFAFSLPVTNDPAAVNELYHVEVAVVTRNGTLDTVGISTVDRVIAAIPLAAATADYNSTHNQLVGMIPGSLLTSSLGSQIFIFSDTEAFVHVTAHNGPMNHTCNFVVQPVDALGTEYMTLLFQDNTICTIMAPDGPAHVWKVTNSESSYIGTVYPDLEVSISLNPGESTGTLFKSNRPVAVFCGTKLNWIQLQATHTWGNEYKTPLFNSSGVDLNTKVRILSNSDNTVVKLNGDFDSTLRLDKRGDFIDHDIDATVSYNITANNAIAVGILYYNDGDPETESDVIMLPAVNNFMDDPVLYTATSETSDMEVNVISNSSHTDTFQIGPLNLPNVYTEWISMTSYAVARSTSYNTNIARNDMSISTMYYKDLTRKFICQVTDALPGDMLDNDCDGLVDEELISYIGYGSTKQDYDLDGAFGEDSLQELLGAQNVSIPPEPYCEESSYVPGINCRRPCLCQCSWVKQLETYTNMTEEERTLAHEIDMAYYREVLSVEKEHLSSTYSTKESANDERQSSANIGVTGIAILCVVFGSIVMLDMITLVKYWHGRKVNAVLENK